MVNANSKASKTEGESKPRKVARTIEQQIEDLRQKQVASDKRKTTRLTKELDTLENTIVKTEATLIRLLGERDVLREKLGQSDATDAVPAEVTSPDVEAPQS